MYYWIKKKKRIRKFIVLYYLYQCIDMHDKGNILYLNFEIFNQSWLLGHFSFRNNLFKFIDWFVFEFNSLTVNIIVMYIYTLKLYIYIYIYKRYIYIYIYNRS